MTLTNKLYKLFLCLSCAVSLVACKVSYSFTGASISPNVKTFSVDDIENVASLIEPGIDNTITEDLKDKFRTETSLNQVRSDGDIQISGQITKYNVTYSGVSSDEEATQNKLTISVKITFVNTDEPLKSFEDKVFSYSEEYDSDESFENVKDDLIETILEQLVEDIFMKAVADW